MTYLIWHSSSVLSTGRPEVKNDFCKGVTEVIAKSFERIHRSNLVGIGIIPLCFKPSEDTETLGLTGHERYTIDLSKKISEIKPGQHVTVTTNTGKSFTCILYFDTKVELAYFDHGGILQYVIRNLMKEPFLCKSLYKVAWNEHEHLYWDLGGTTLVIII